MTLDAIPYRVLSRIVQTPGPLPTMCWIWQGTRVGTGRDWTAMHGRVWWRGRMVLAHRLMWWLTRGYSPKGGCVLHRCDNPPCVNPYHLTQGSQSQNIRHQYKRQRRAPLPISV